MNNPSLTNSPEPKPSPPKSFWQKMLYAPRWCRWYLFWMIFTAIVWGIAPLLIKTHDEAILFLITVGVATYMIALAALIRTFVKEK
jgi:hypothetical protein